MAVSAHCDLVTFPFEPAPLVKISKRVMADESIAFLDALALEARVFPIELTHLQGVAYTRINQDDWDEVRKKDYAITVRVNDTQPDIRILFDIHDLKNSTLLDYHEIAINQFTPTTGSDETYRTVANWIISRVMHAWNAQQAAEYH